MGNNKSTVSSRYIFVVAIGSFILAVIFTLLSETFASKFNNLLLSFVFLAVIITINILADLVGTAVTAASHTPFNAKAAKRVKGAPQGLQLIKNADRVANIANDIIGDITTTVSGALGISIVVQIMRVGPQFDQFWLNVLLTALISVFIVTGKAVGKKLSLSHPDEIIFFVGTILAKIERATGYSPFQKQRGSKNKQKVGKQ
ncbi:MAG: hypothetical protein A4E52_00213 [Pelotomaculum sp. PtaB.Bin013]|uniref:CNNM transmembrane domain-containing protein n=1 Tax=Pelotomaculum isophthalicicum JI TaxID=947010 RepID=A0A9X4H0T7_9FIRM|nr:hypothetical protein [Pelotomaculum isophthalicicum]MDF9407470.1 hypothetical protein [Pelotomaculum isophthalicicum JI]OPX92002.1 MAG: hypothetical protein A4E52_00213 [Pelotomaculum sp. PtaB.Bin013]